MLKISFVETSPQRGFVKRWRLPVSSSDIIEVLDTLDRQVLIGYNYCERVTGWFLPSFISSLAIKVSISLFLSPVSQESRGSKPFRVWYFPCRTDSSNIPWSSIVLLNMYWWRDTISWSPRKRRKEIIPHTSNLIRKMSFLARPLCFIFAVFLPHIIHLSCDVRFLLSPLP